MFEKDAKLLAKINSHLNHPEETLKKAINTMDALNDWYDSDFPYPHLDPEDDPNWVEPTQDVRELEVLS